MATGSNHTYTPLFRTNQNAAVSALCPNYSDVFGRLDGGGVPVLKLPVNHPNGEKELPFDLGLVDYDEVFGGYHDWSFAASYEDVFGISSGGEMLEEEEACWTHLEDASSLEKPYRFTQSNILSSENGDQSLDINRRLRVLDRIIPSESKGDTETGLKNSLMERSDTDSIRCGRKSQNVSQSNGAFLTISGINLRTHPSKCPPPSRNPPLLYVQNEDLKCLRTQSRGSRSRSYSFQGTVSSPTFHDVEVDASSSAAASAAAMLDAMEKTQAKLNSAKEMMQPTYHLKRSQKTSVKQSFIDGSSISKENLVQKVKAATEGRKSFASDGLQNLTNAAEMVSQSRGEMNQNSIDHKFVVKRRRQGRPGSWSCRDSEKCVSINGAVDSSDLFDMELAGRQLLEVENKTEMAFERAGMPKEQIKYEENLSSANDQKTTKKQLVGADSCNKSDISKEVLQEANIVNIYVGADKESQRKESNVTKPKSTDGRARESRDHNMLHIEKCDVSEHRQMNTEADSTEQCDQGLERKTPKLAEIGSELTEEACGREQNLKGLSLTCDPEENEESLKQSYELNVDKERSETLSKRQNSDQFTVAREGRESKKLQSDDYTTTMSASHAKPYLSEEHFMDGRAEIVKPLGLLYEQTENRSVENSRVSPGCVKLDLNAGDVGHEHEDIFEENHVAQDESLCEKIMEVVENDIRALHLGENNRNSVAAATAQYAAREVLIQSHMFSESIDHEEMVTEFGEEVVLCNKGQVPVSGLMTSDPQKLPKMVDLEVQHLPKIRPTSENSCSFQQHHRSDEAVNISMLGKNKKMLHEQLKKLEKERNREREKDNLVVERALHEVREKARNDVEKAAVERGPTECQQNAVGDSVKPKELQADSPQRCKARLERQRRTAERAARALAEKNMCDLAAQREQAERNRLADSLGAEVKRWATGKEGNLRALLSTLQYILRPDSGWKPIPLTEVITPVAVKKAYRKATLYVHPDKVQQRGANVQQKFICEKVFDLIKDAWNKFNSDA